LHRFVEIEVDGSYGLPHDATLASGAGGSFSLLEFGARVCVPVGGAAFSVGPCLGAAVAGLHGEGIHVSVSKQADAWWWGPEAGIVARVRLAGALGLRAAALGYVPIARRSWVIDDAPGVVAKTWPVGFRTAFGPEVQF
jgi:hypothetical protein